MEKKELEGKLDNMLEGLASEIVLQVVDFEEKVLTEAYTRLLKEVREEESLAIAKIMLLALAKAGGNKKALFQASKGLE